MEQIEAFINSRMTDMSFQPKNNNTLPKQIKQSNFYSTASTTPTDIMDVSKAYCWTYYYFSFIKLISREKKILSFFCNWTNNSQHRIYQTSLIFHLYFNSHFTKKFILKKKLFTFICIPPPPQKTIKKTQLHIVPRPSKFQIWKFLVFFQNCLYYYYYIINVLLYLKKKKCCKNPKFWILK